MHSRLTHSPFATLSARLGLASEAAEPMTTPDPNPAPEPATEPQDEPAAAARARYHGRFDRLADAVEFEEMLLGSGYEFLSPEARLVVDGEGLDPASAVAYYDWLTAQHAAATG